MRFRDTRALYERMRDLPAKKILVIKLRAIGDVVLSTVILPNLAAAFRDAEIHFLTERAAAPIVEGNPHVDRVLLFRKGETPTLRFLANLRRERYDVVFDLFCNPRSAFMTQATGAPFRVGYPFRFRAYAYNVHIPFRREVTHNTQFNLNPLERLGIPVTSRTLSIPSDDSPRVREFLDALRSGGAPVVALNAGGTWESKRWGLENFARLGDMIAERSGARILLLWGPGEERDASEIAGRMRRPAAIAPPTDLRELAALLRGCDALVSNDAGPMHIGAAAGVPTLGIFGPTNPLAQGPYSPLGRFVRREGLDCLGCNLTRCPIGNICMTELGVETVFDAFLTLPKRNPG